MLLLIPEKVNFEISTTDVLVEYTEKPEVVIKIDALDLENYLERKIYKNIDIKFRVVAELKCSSLNFHEANYDEFEIFKINENGDDYSFWKKNNYHPDSGFYQVDDSRLLSNTKDKYDPTGSLKLKHFLIIGNDSYIEILASNYIVIDTPR